MENENIIIEVEEDVVETRWERIKAKAKGFVDKHKMKLAVAGTALVSTAVVAVIMNMNDTDDEDEEVVEHYALPETEENEVIDVTFEDVKEETEETEEEPVNVEA